MVFMFPMHLYSILLFTILTIPKQQAGPKLNYQDGNPLEKYLQNQLK